MTLAPCASALQGLCHLLEQLSDWFSPSLGVKLLEHLSKWALPEGPMGKTGVSGVAWRQGEEVAVAAQILDTFHLLPRQVRRVRSLLLHSALLTCLA